MRRALLMASLAAGTLCCRYPVDAAQHDEDVYRAVLVHVIQPEARRLKGTAPIHLADVTAVVCGKPIQAPHVDCIREGSLGYFRDGLPRGGRQLFPDLSSAERLTLADQMWKRNEASHPLAPFGVEGVRLTAPAAMPTVIDGSVSGGIATLSRPAYTESGKALVYASYVCGGLCGYGWFVLLEQRTGAWVVAGKHLLWIS